MQWHCQELIRQVCHFCFHIVDFTPPSSLLLGLYHYLSPPNLPTDTVKGAFGSVQNCGWFFVILGSNYEPWASCLHLCASVVIKQYHLVPVKGRWCSEGWEGDCRSGDALAMCHRLCGLSTYRLEAYVKEMSTLHKLNLGTANLYLLYYERRCFGDNGTSTKSW